MKTPTNHEAESSTEYIPTSIFKLRTDHHLIRTLKLLIKYTSLLTCFGGDEKAIRTGPNPTLSIFGTNGRYVQYNILVLQAIHLDIANSKFLFSPYAVKVKAIISRNVPKSLLFGNFSPWTIGVIVLNQASTLCSTFHRPSHREKVFVSSLCGRRFIFFSVLSNLPLSTLCASISFECVVAKRKPG